MQKPILIAVLFLLTFFIDNSCFSQSQKLHCFAPFQGKRVFCSTEHNEKAFITIKGNQVSVVMGNRKIKGTYKRNKVLLTNDPSEILYRKNAGKYHYGTFYVIARDYLSILESENGEYAYFYELCK